MKKILPLILASTLYLASCSDPIIEIKTPATATPSPVSVKTGSLVVSVVDGFTQKPIENSSVKISYDKNSKTQNTDKDGKTTFNDLPEGSNYSIEASANGYLLTSLNSTNSKINIKQTTPSAITISIFKTTGSLSGRITTESGEPIENAVVSISSSSSITDSNGSFKLKVTELLSNSSVTVSKIGYKTQIFSGYDFSKQLNIETGNLSLIAKADKNIVIDTGKKSFGDTGDNISILDDFSAFLKENKFNVTYVDIANYNDIDKADIIVIPSPYLVYSSAEVDKITNLVKAGKKLIILGEWGGYLGFTPESVNSILKKAHLTINQDVVKELDTSNIIDGTLANNEKIIVSKFTNHAITRGLNKISFYSSASVDIISGGETPLDIDVTKIVATTGSNSFRIKTYSKGPVGLIGVSVLGAGKIIAIGDTSLFAKSTSDNKISNLASFDNKQLTLNIMNW